MLLLHRHNKRHRSGLISVQSDQHHSYLFSGKYNRFYLNLLQQSLATNPAPSLHKINAVL